MLHLFRPAGRKSRIDVSLNVLLFYKNVILSIEYCTIFSAQELAIFFILFFRRQFSESVNSVPVYVYSAETHLHTLMMLAIVAGMTNVYLRAPRRTDSF